MREHGGGNRRIAVDHLDPEGVAELARLGISVGNGEAVMENARLIKSPDEILAMRRAIVACEAAMGEMEAALKPGISENELWAELHRGNIARGGEWIETRLLSSGPRTNPWFQECSSRKIEAGDLVAFDTDLIGPYGFCADLSRTWLCGDGKPTDEQRDLFRIAADQIAHNTELMRPGIGFRELVERSKNPPPDCFPARYGVLYHGVGLADEYPTLPHAADWTDDTPDGVLEPGMVLCVESYIGRLGGHEGVKIEEQVLITETGNETAVDAIRWMRGCSAADAQAAPSDRSTQRFHDLFRRVALTVMNGRPLRRRSSRRPATSAGLGSWRCAMCPARQSMAQTSALPSATATIEARWPPVSMRSEKMSRLSPIASRSRVSAMMPDMESRLL